MRTKNLLLVVLFVYLPCISLNAQSNSKIQNQNKLGITFSLTGFKPKGLNTAFQNYDRVQSGSSPDAGMWFRHHFISWLGFQTELNYQNRFASLNDTITSYRVEENYYNIPLLLHINTNVDSTKTNYISLIMGPSLSILRKREYFPLSISNVNFQHENLSFADIIKLTMVYDFSFTMKFDSNHTVVVGTRSYDDLSYLKESDEASVIKIKYKTFGFYFGFALNF